MWPKGWQQASAATHVALPGWEKYNLCQIDHSYLKGTRRCWTQAKPWFSTCQIYTGRGTSTQHSGLSPIHINFGFHNLTEWKIFNLLGKWRETISVENYKLWGPISDSQYMRVNYTLPHNISFSQRPRF